MNKLHFLVLFFGLTCVSAFSQTCTITGTSPLLWPGNGATLACAEGGNAMGKTTLVIPAGLTVVFDNNSDTWSGASIEVYGTLNIPVDVTINSSLVVNNGGVVNVSAKLALGSSAGCSYTVIVRSGGQIELAGTAAARVSICGKTMMQGNGGCNNCSGTNSATCAYVAGQPYCEPTSGFTGPSGYDEGGYNASLPVKLLYFLTDVRDEKVLLFWATSLEENFYKFVVQRSVDGLTFEDIGQVNGKGFNIYGTETEYGFTDNQPVLGYNYYRLKAVDLDEAFEYFGVKAVKVNGSKALSVFPNPVSGQTISFNTNFSPQESDRLVLTDQLGVEIYNAPATRVQNTIALSEKVAPGIYTLRYQSDDFALTARILITN